MRAAVAVLSSRGLWIVRACMTTWRRIGIECAGRRRAATVLSIAASSACAGMISRGVPLGRRINVGDDDHANRERVRPGAAAPALSE